LSRLRIHAKQNLNTGCGAVKPERGRSRGFSRRIGTLFRRMKKPFRSIALLLALVTIAALAGCTRSRAPAKRQAAPLSDEQQRLNVESFDKVWTIVRERHWDPNLAGVDWDAARAELRPKVEAATTMDDARGVMEDLIHRLKQSHFGIVPREVYSEVSSASDAAKPEKKRSSDHGTTGIELAIIEGRAIVAKVSPDSPAATSGVQPGWIVERVGKRDLAKVLARVEKAYADSSLHDFYVHAAAATRAIAALERRSS
jgi:C-terminal processing protease CtpA/Prc